MKISSLLPIAALLGLISPNRLAAQAFTTLHSFSAVSSNSGGTNTDGAAAWPGLVLSGNALYGCALEGGAFGRGTIYRINKDGTGFQILHSFSSVRNGVNTDGAGPTRGLIVSNSTIYGASWVGGASGTGTIFKLATDGTAFTTLYSFDALKNGTNHDGAGPSGVKVLLGNRLYGTAYSGGTGGSGSIFAINTDGSGFTNLYNFSALDPITLLNEDGANPGDLVLVNNRLYGTAQAGGSSSAGTIFTIGVDGSGFTLLHTFAFSDGYQPYPGLIASGNTLYGTTYWGGNSWPNSGGGTIFTLNTDGTSFQSLYSFTDASQQTNSDGCCPQGELVLVGNALYGTASHAGPNGVGSIFALNTDGTGFTNLYSFSADSGLPSYTNTDGGTPAGLLVVSAGMVYGTTVDRGPSGSGTIFSLSLGGVTVPQLAITLSGPSITWAWPIGATGYLLQSATTLANGGDWRDLNWVLNQTNGQNIVSVTTSVAPEFFRLRHQ